MKQADDSAEAPWSCIRCGSGVDGDMSVCWKCGAGSDGTPDPTFVPAIVERALPLKCEHCGYDLRQLDSDRCPECGRGFERTTPETAPPTPIESREWSATARIFLVGPLLVALLAALGFILFIGYAGWRMGAGM